MARPTNGGTGASGRSSAWTGIAQALASHPTHRPRVNVTFWSALAVLWLIIIVVAASGANPSRPSRPSRTSRNTAAGPVVGDTITASASTDLATSSSTQAPPTPATSPASPRPADTTGSVRINAAGAVLPDPNRTPGATNPTVTQADIGSTICVSGWTATVRPPSSYTTTLKEQQLASGYTFHGDTSTADYEEDHLIALEIGGSPTSQLNLWPEPYNTPDGARVKDVVENRLHDLVCAGSLSLATAQHAIASNWWNAYLTYVGAPPPVTTAAPAPTTGPPAQLSCQASMTNASPAQYSTTDVIVHTAAGAGVTATAHYKTTDTTHAGTASGSGVADIAFSISRATIGYTVRVDVTVSRGGASNACSTSFTPQ